jgi:hypothetical protein
MATLAFATIATEVLPRRRAPAKTPAHPQANPAQEREAA